MFAPRRFGHQAETRRIATVLCCCRSAAVRMIERDEKKNREGRLAVAVAPVSIIFI